MTDATASAKGTAPTHIAYQVKESGDKGYWNRIGAAWQNRDRKGFSIQLDSLPLDGRIILRLATEEVRSA